jgi:hypothetical protein
MTETILLTWLLLAFMAALYQLFLVNETIYRSLVSVHQRMLAGAYQANCFEKRADCTFDGAVRRAQVVWRRPDVPEADIPVVGIFQRFGLPRTVRLRSNSPYNPDDFKRTRVTSGTYYPVWDFLLSGMP